MTDLIVCPSCKKLTRYDDVHTCFDFDALERRREAEKAVVEAAKGWEAAFSDYAKVPYTIARAHAVTKAEDAVIVAVRALNALDASEGGA